MEKCKSKTAHRGHLCVLAAAEKFADIAALAEQPRFICFNCGRVARSKKNLCNPMPLKSGAQ